MFFKAFFILLSLHWSAFSMLPGQALHAPDGIQINFANVGQGNGVFLKNQRNGKYLVIDAGQSTLPEGVADGDELAQRVAQFIGLEPVPLAPAPVAKIIAITTHPDKDHISLFNNFVSIAQLSFIDRIQDFYLGGNFLHYVSADAVKLLNDIIYPLTDPASLQNAVSLSHKIDKGKLHELSHKASLVKADKDFLKTKSIPFTMHLNISNFLDVAQIGVRLEFLCINAFHSGDMKHIFDVAGAREISNIPLSKIGKRAEKSNKVSAESVNGDGSIVRLSLGGNNFIFTGDATGKTTKRILDNVSDPAKLKSRILMASHHGAETHETNSASWALATSPERVIFSAGLNSGFEHPRFQAIFNYLMIPSLTDIPKHEVIFEQNFGPRAKEILSYLSPTYLENPNFYIHVDKKGKAHEWLKAETTKAIYTTTCTPAGEKGISFNLALNGDIG